MTGQIAARIQLALAGGIGGALVWAVFKADEQDWVGQYPAFVLFGLVLTGFGALLAMAGPIGLGRALPRASVLAVLVAALIALTALRYGKTDDFLNAPMSALAALTVALGFAVGENALYAQQYGREVLLVRFLWPVPAHLAYAAVWGYGLARARFGPPGAPGSGWRTFATSLVGAGLLHATANLVLLLGPNAAALVGLSALVGLLWLAHQHLLRLVAASPYLEPGECPECRNLNPDDSPVCVYCGTTLRDPDFVRSCPSCAFPRVPIRATACPRCHAPLPHTA